jgi:hypothetical protein
LLPALQDVAADQGSWPTLLAVLKALRQRPAKLPPNAMLSNHLRRDVSLPKLLPLRPLPLR